jgi:hypothetical protein
METLFRTKHIREAAEPHSAANLTIDQNKLLVSCNQPIHYFDCRVNRKNRSVNRSRTKQIIDYKKDNQWNIVYHTRRGKRNHTVKLINPLKKQYEKTSVTTAGNHGLPAPGCTASKPVEWKISSRKLNTIIIPQAQWTPFPKIANRAEWSKADESMMKHF